MAAPAFASVQGPKGLSSVFYVTSDNLIRQWRQEESQEKLYGKKPANSKDDFKFYERQEYSNPAVKNRDGKTFETCSKDLSVVVLTNVPNQYHLRLYFANEAGLLSEICQDLDATTFEPIGKSLAPDADAKGVWFKGSLEAAKIPCKSGTAISAHVTKKDGKDHTLKVYYFPKNPLSGDGVGSSSRPAVAWFPLDGSRPWATTNSGV